MSQRGPCRWVCSRSPAWWLLVTAAALAGLLQLNVAHEPIAGLTAQPTGDFASEGSAPRARIWTSEGNGGA